MIVITLVWNIDLYRSEVWTVRNKNWLFRSLPYETVEKEKVFLKKKVKKIIKSGSCRWKKKADGSDPDMEELDWAYSVKRWTTEGWYWRKKGWKESRKETGTIIC